MYMLSYEVDCLAVLLHYHWLENVVDSKLVFWDNENSIASQNIAFKMTIVLIDMPL
jgi:hypothetical protein